MRARRGPALVILALLVALVFAPPLSASPLRPFFDPVSLISTRWFGGWLTRLAAWLDGGDARPNGDVATCIDPSGNRVPCAP